MKHTAVVARRSLHPSGGWCVGALGPSDKRPSVRRTESVPRSVKQLNLRRDHSSRILSSARTPPACAHPLARPARTAGLCPHLPTRAGSACRTGLPRRAPVRLRIALPDDRDGIGDGRSRDEPVGGHEAGVVVLSVVMHCRSSSDRPRCLRRTTQPEDSLGRACSASSNRLVRTRMCGGVGGVRSNAAPIPISGSRTHDLAVNSIVPCVVGVTFLSGTLRTSSSCVTGSLSAATHRSIAHGPHRSSLRHHGTCGSFVARSRNAWRVDQVLRSRLGAGFANSATSTSRRVIGMPYFLDRRSRRSR